VQSVVNDGHAMSAELMRCMVAYQTALPSVDAACMYHHPTDLPL